MDQFYEYPQNGKHEMIMKHKKRLSQDQVRLLETNFSLSNKLDSDRKAQLALQLGLPPRQVAVWYQNKRAREKNQNLEVDHKDMRLRLESVLAENARLKGEVERLKAELNKSQGMLSSLNSSVSSDEIGSSNLIGGIGKQHNNLERDFYASLIDGGGGQFAGSDGYDFFGNLT